LSTKSVTINMDSEDIFDELDGGCCKNGYCFYKTIFRHVKFDKRTLVQIKCLEKFKYEQSERARVDIGEHNTVMKWVNDGYAEAFDKVFSTELKFLEIYSKTITLVESASRD